MAIKVVTASKDLDVISQYDALVTGILDELTEIMGSWIEMDDCFLPDHLYPISRTLKATYKAQRSLQKQVRSMKRGLR